jgi:hypothetical protein
MTLQKSSEQIYVLELTFCYRTLPVRRHLDKLHYMLRTCSAVPEASRKQVYSVQEAQ